MSPIHSCLVREITSYVIPTCLSNLEIIEFKKIPLTAKLDSAYGIFFIQLSPNWTASIPITYTKQGCSLAEKAVQTQ